MGLHTRSPVLGSRAVKTLQLPVILLLAGSGSLGCYNLASVTNGGDGGPTGPGGGTDAGGGADSSAPPSNDGGTAGKSFCKSLSPQPKFCDDFDEEDGGTFGVWDTLPSSSFGTATVSQNFSSSAPNSLLSQTGAIAAGNEDVEVDLQKEFVDFANEAVSITVAFDMNVQEWDPGSGQIIASEVLFKGGTGDQTLHQIVLNLTSLGGTTGVTGQIAENAPLVDGGVLYEPHGFDQHPVVKAWTHVEIDLTLPTDQGSTSNIVTVKLDGTTVLNAQALTVPLTGGTPWTRLGIGGVTLQNAEGPWAVYYDNFTVTISQI